MSPMAHLASHFLATRSEVLPTWMPTTRPRRSSDDVIGRLRPTFTARPWSNCR